MKQVHVFQHVPAEGAGTMLDHLRAAGIPVRTVALYRGDALPPPDDVAAALVMGGPMGVDDEKDHPWLAPETELVRELAQRDVPTIGVCLGSQLIAKALGKRVYKAPKPEVGWCDVTLTDEARRDPLFASVAGPSLRVLQWHEDTFDVPDGAVTLATGADVPNQAFRYKSNVYAFQFHLEADRAMIDEWFKGRPDAPRIAAEYDALRPPLRALTEAMYAAFFRRALKGAPVRP